MAGQATTIGLLTLTVTFRLGTDADKEPSSSSRTGSLRPGRAIAGEVHDTLGVTTVRLGRPDDGRPVLSPDDRLTSPTCTFTRCSTSGDRLARIPGVGDVRSSAPATIRCRLLARSGKVARGLSATEVAARDRAQNVRRRPAWSAGHRFPGLDLQLSINAEGRLRTTGGVRVRSSSSRAERRKDHPALRHRSDRTRHLVLRAALAARHNKPAVAVPVFKRRDRTRSRSRSGPW